MRTMLFLWIVSGLSLWAHPARDTSTYAYHCSDGYDFVARFESEGVWIFGPDGSRLLPFVRKGGEGETLYLGDGTRFRFGGERAALEKEGRLHTGCVNDRRRALWEEAKLRGVDFRAVGNEPPWILEITGERLDLWVGYEKRHYRFHAEPRVDRKRRQTRYMAREGGETLEVVLQPGPCSDSMADVTYGVKVTVRFRGRTLRGCGEALH